MDYYGNRKKIKKILVSEIFVEIPEENMGLDDSLRNEFGIDSLGFVELRVNCEEEFEVKISDDDFTPENFQSINSVANLIRRLQLVNN
ncbi:acyl carrier protein [Bacillus cereus]